MARNFGDDQTSVWPMLAIAFVAVGLITAATIVHHG
jgi:hypothetical protein